MPDYSFIANPQQTSPMTSIGNVLGIAQKAQDLQSGALGLQKQTQANNERIATQQFMSQPQNWQDDSGNIDLGKLNATIPKIAPMTGAETIQKMTTLAGAQTQANSAKLNFSGDERKVVGQLYGVLGRANVTDPAQVSSELETLKAQYPDNPNMQKYIEAAKVPLGMTGPSKDLPGHLITQSQSLLNPSEQQSQLAPTAGLTSIGGSTVQTTTTPAVGGNAPTATAAIQGTPNTLPPGSVEETIKGPDGNLYVQSKGPNGQILGTRPLAGGAQGGTGNGPAMPRFAPGDAEAIPQLQQEVINAKNTALAAPDIHNNTRGILSELDNVSATGIMGPTFQKINSALGGGLDWSSKEKAASSYDLVGKYLERNALQLAQGMGPHTNAGLDTVKAASGTVAYNSDAIRSIAKLVDANASGQEAYYPALQKAIAANPQRGVLAKQDFDQQWAQNYDPRIFQVRNALQAGDKAELARLKTQLGPQGMKQMQQKFQNLQALGVSGGP